MASASRIRRIASSCRGDDNGVAFLLAKSAEKRGEGLEVDYFRDWLGSFLGLAVAVYSSIAPMDHAQTGRLGAL